MSEGTLEISQVSYRWSAAALLLLAFVLRIWAIDSGLPHLRTRPDEFAVVEMTQRSDAGHYDIGWSIYPHSFIHLHWLWAAVGLEIGQIVSAAPEGSYVEVMRTSRPTLYILMRSLSAVVGTLAVWITLALTRRVFGRVAALGAGGLVATSFLLVRDSQVIKPDILLSTGVLLTLFAIVPLARNASVRRGVAAGLAAGVAMAFKFPGILLAPSVYLASLMGSRPFHWKRLLPIPAIASALAAAVFFVASNPFIVFGEQALDTWSTLLGTVVPVLFADDPEERRSREPPTGTRTFQIDPERFAELKRATGEQRFANNRWWMGFVFHSTFSLRYGMGLLATILAPFAFLWGVTRRDWAQRAFTWPAALFVAVYYGVFGLSPAQVMRYMTPLVPIFLILEAAMLSELVARFATARRWGGGRATAAIAGVLLLLAAEPLVNSVAHDRIASRTDTRVLATRWLADNTPEGSRVKFIGSVFMPWGNPHIARGRRASRAKATPDALELDGVTYVVTNDHILWASTIDPDVFSVLEPRLTLLAEFDPNAGAAGDPGEAIFESGDAYYIPVRGFGSVARPGPRIRVYAFGE